jgi:hypothetical protein
MQIPTVSFPFHCKGPLVFSGCFEYPRLRSSWRLQHFTKRMPSQRYLQSTKKTSTCNCKAVQVCIRELPILKACRHPTTRPGHFHMQSKLDRVLCSSFILVNFGPYLFYLFWKHLYQSSCCWAQQIDSFSNQHQQSPRLSYKWIHPYRLSIAKT